MLFKSLLFWQSLENCKANCLNSSSLQSQCIFKYFVVVYWWRSIFEKESLVMMQVFFFLIIAKERQVQRTVHFITISLSKFISIFFFFQNGFKCNFCYNSCKILHKLLWLITCQAYKYLKLKKLLVIVKLNWLAHKITSLPF